MRWDVDSSIGIDAVLLIGAAAGDVLQAEHYPGEICWARERLPSEALETLDRQLRVEQGHLIGPTLAYVFSAGPTGTLSDVIDSAQNPAERLLPELLMSPSWTDDGAPSTERMLELLPTVVQLLAELESIGFAEWWTENFVPLIERGIVRNREALEPYDVIAEQERLLGRELDPLISVTVAYFARPYGIRVVGQRLIAPHDYDPSVQLRIAAHEIFHPPFDLSDTRMWQRLEELRTDPWMTAIVRDHDPKFGYNSFKGLVNEDSTQALDQVVSDRLGLARDPGQRWSTDDDGMHLLAAAIYHAMEEDGFDRTGGVYGEWLAGALDRGLLTPTEVRCRATAIVGANVVESWLER